MNKFLLFLFIFFTATKVNAQRVHHLQFDLRYDCAEQVISITKEIKKHNIKEVYLHTYFVTDSDFFIRNVNKKSLGLYIDSNSKKPNAANNILNSPVLMKSWVYAIHSVCKFGYYVIAQYQSSNGVIIAVDNNNNFFFEECSDNPNKIKNNVSNIYYILGHYCAFVPF